MNKNRKKNTVTESAAEAKLKGFLDMIAPSITISVEIHTVVSGHLESILLQRMNRRFLDILEKRMVLP